MSVRILIGVADGDTEEISCFFDSKKGVAFGPIMGDLQKAKAFCTWMSEEQGRTYILRMEAQDLCNYWYPKFEIIYAGRLCAVCNSYRIETEKSLCHLCRGEIV